MLERLPPTDHVDHAQRGNDRIESRPLCQPIKVRRDMIGYHRGTIDFNSIRKSTQLPLIVEAVGARDVIALRAMSVTSQARYQMDSVDFRPGEPFVWPIDLLRQASSLGATRAADVEAMGVLACTARCSDRPDTVYWPVSVSRRASR